MSDGVWAEVIVVYMFASLGHLGSLALTERGGELGSEHFLLTALTHGRTSALPRQSDDLVTAVPVVPLCVEVQ